MHSARSNTFTDRPRPCSPLPADRRPPELYGAVRGAVAELLPRLKVVVVDKGSLRVRVPGLACRTLLGWLVVWACLAWVVFGPLGRCVRLDGGDYFYLPRGGLEEGKQERTPHRTQLRVLAQHTHTHTAPPPPHPSPPAGLTLRQ